MKITTWNIRHGGDVIKIKSLFIEFQQYLYKSA